MIRKSFLLLSLLITGIALSAQDGGDVLFTISKPAPKADTVPHNYYYIETSCEAGDDTVNSVRITVQGDTLIFAAINVREVYFSKDSSTTQVSFDEFSRVRMIHKQDKLSFSELYKNGEESGDILFLSTAPKSKTPDCYNLLCNFELRRNCRQQHNAALQKKQTITLANHNFDCLVVTINGTKTQRGKFFKGQEANFAYFNTHITYWLDERTFLPVFIQEESAEKSYPYCHTWLLNSIAN